MMGDGDHDILSSRQPRARRTSCRLTPPRKFRPKDLLRGTRAMAGLRGRLRSDLPELLGIPSIGQPELVRHWSRVIARSRSMISALPPAQGPRIALVVSLAEGNNVTGYTAVIAYALRLRGADPFIVYCDAALAACENEPATILFMTPQEFITEGPRRFCDACFRKGQGVYETIGLPAYPLSRFLDAAARDEVERWADDVGPDHGFQLEYKGLPIGPHVEGSVARFYFANSARLEDLRDDPQVVRRLSDRMMRGSGQMAEALLRMDAELRPDIYVSRTGIYASEGVPPLVARNRGKRSIVWVWGYVEENVMLGNDEYTFTELADRTTGPWQDLSLTGDQEDELDHLLLRRTGGDFIPWIPWRGQSMTDFRPNLRPMQERQDEIVNALGLDRERPIVGLYTNVAYDAKLVYDTRAYPDVFSWVFDSIEIFAGRPEQLVIRVHPQEAWISYVDPRVRQDVRAEWIASSQELTARAIRERFPVLPENVRVIPSTSKLSSYALSELSTAVIAYGSPIGLELAALGKSVVVCGRAPYWRKGFTFDVHDQHDYQEMVERLAAISAPDPIRTAAARRYAYYFYFLKQIPFLNWYYDHHKGLRMTPWWKRFRSLEQLMPGADPYLDAICEQILVGREALRPSGATTPPGSAERPKPVHA